MAEKDTDDRPARAQEPAAADSGAQATLPSLIRHHPDAVGLVTFPEGLIVDLNDAFTAITGFSRDEAVGALTTEIGLWATPAQRDRFLAELREHGQVTGMELDYRRRDGSVGPGAASVELVELAGRTYSLWILRDLAEQRATEEKLRRRSAELETLLDIATALGGTTELDATLDTIVHRAARTLGSGEAEIVVYDEETDVVRTAAIYQTQPTDWAAALGEPVTGPEAELDKELMARPGCTIQRRDDPRLDAVTRQIMDRWGDHVYLCVPLRFDRRPLGLLVYIETQHEREYSDEELALAMAIGDQAALAVHTARQFELQREQNRRLAALVQASRVLALELDLESLNAELAHVAVDALVADWCSVFEYHADEGTVTEAAICPRSGGGQPQMVGRTYRISRRLPVAADEYPLDVRQLESGRVLVESLSDPDLDPASRADMEQQGEKTCLTVPLLSAGRPVGFFVIVHEREEHVFTASEIDVARAIAEQASVAWERIRLYKRLELLSITDGLTGVFNHRHFYERLAAEIKRADRYGSTLPLLMIDIDDFKLFNDRHGHQAGDDALRIVARVITDQVRTGVDLVARYGGEEFTVLLPGSHDAVAAAERIRESVRAATMETPTGDAPLTVSVGVATYPENAADMDDLVARADAAMYIAKRLGKDRVEQAGRR